MVWICAEEGRWAKDVEDRAERQEKGKRKANNI